MTSLRFVGPMHASGKYDKFEMKRHYYCLSEERKKSDELCLFLLRSMAIGESCQSQIQHRPLNLLLFASILKMGCWFHIVFIANGCTCIFLNKFRHEELLYILSDVYNVIYVKRADPFLERGSYV